MKRITESDIRRIVKRLILEDSKESRLKKIKKKLKDFSEKQVVFFY